MSRRRMSRTHLHRAEVAARTVDRPLVDLTSKLATATDDQRQRAALFLLVGLPRERRLELLAEHLPELVDLADNPDADDVLTALVLVVDAWLATQTTDALRLRLLRNDIP